MCRGFHSWVQTIAIFAAGAWALYTFGYKEYYLPATAPSYLENHIDVRPKGGRNGLIGIEVRVTLKNSGTRKVYVLPSSIVLSAHAVAPNKLSVNDFQNRADQYFDELKGDRMVSRFGEPEVPEVVGVGQLFTDWLFEPNEEATRSLVFYLPADSYDLIAVQTIFPITTKKRRVSARWKFREDGFPGLTVSEIDSEDKEIRVVKRHDGTQADWAFLREVQYGEIQSNAMVLLGESESAGR